MSVTLSVTIAAMTAHATAESVALFACGPITLRRPVNEGSGTSANGIPIDSRTWLSTSATVGGTVTAGGTYAIGTVVTVNAMAAPDGLTRAARSRELRHKQQEQRPKRSSVAIAFGHSPLRGG